MFLVLFANSLVSTLRPEAKELHRSSLTSYETYLKVFVFLTFKHALRNSVSPAVKCIQIEEMSVRYRENIGFSRGAGRKQNVPFLLFIHQLQPNLFMHCTQIAIWTHGNGL